MTKLWRLLIIIVVAVCGCSITPPAPTQVDPAFQHPLFNSLGVDRIILLPAVDLRLEKTGKADYVKWFEQPITARLRAKNYEADRTLALNAPVSFSDLPSKVRDPSWIKELGPSFGQWVFLVTIDELYRKVTFGAKGTAKVSGYLFDTDKGELIWQHKGEGEVAAGVLMSALVDNGALEAAGNDLILGFPIRMDKGEN